MPFAWTDDPLVVNSTKVKAVHTTELRDNIDAMLVSVGEAKYSWTDTITTNATKVKAVHFSEMQTALDKAYDSNHCNTHNISTQISNLASDYSTNLSTPHYSTNLSTPHYSVYNNNVETGHLSVAKGSNLKAPHYSDYDNAVLSSHNKTYYSSQKNAPHKTTHYLTNNSVYFNLADGTMA